MLRESLEKKFIYQTYFFKAALENAPGQSRISVPELIHQLQVTQDELENIRVSPPAWHLFEPHFVIE